MENTENKKEEMNVHEGALELCIDTDHITIPVSRFEELVKAEIKLDIVRQVYETKESYSMKDSLLLIFGPLPEKGDDNA
ncbi:MAG: hypothetical protein K9L62_00260 [Vallitaleaceae bacterium]|nr:hypothetical protein [Vallitaleaceae bacterium]